MRTDRFIAARTVFIHALQWYWRTHMRTPSILCRETAVERFNELMQREVYGMEQLSKLISNKRSIIRSHRRYHLGLPDGTTMPDSRTTSDWVNDMIFIFTGGRMREEHGAECPPAKRQRGGGELEDMGGSDEFLRLVGGLS